MDSLEDYLFTKNTKWIFWGAAGLIVGLLIFHAGYAMGSRHNEAFGSGREIKVYGFGMPMGIMPPKTFIMGGHGATGTITAISFPTLMIKSDDGDDVQTVVLDASTSIRDSQMGMPPQYASSSSLMVGEHVIILGAPIGSSTIDAKLIDIH